ncbi:MAG: hypothetical protein ACRDJE_07215 [Dehalococcoidia bacterium]
MTTTSSSDPVAITEELCEAAQRQGWPKEMIDRARRVRVSPDLFRRWLAWGDRPEHLEHNLDRIEQSTFGSLRVREATVDDNEKYAELFLNSPERIGDWEVTVDRSPHAFAQFRLQEHVQIQVLEEEGILLTSIARSTRNALVGGVPLNVRFSSAARTRHDARRRGLSWHVRSQSPACVPYANADYWYFRSQNFSALAWLRAGDPDRLSDAPEREGDVPGIPVAIHLFAPGPYDGSTEGIRPAQPADAQDCVALINRTHDGQDLFRPYTVELFQQRLDDGGWGPKPEWWIPVYGWGDYHILEERGQIVACAGLWDRGRHMREHWRNTVTGEQRLLERTALLDFGFAEGHEAAMARLIEHLIGETHRLGRTQLMAPIEQHPALVEQLAGHGPAVETWSMEWEFHPPQGSGLPQLTIINPYTDLAYW